MKPDCGYFQGDMFELVNFCALPGVECNVGANVCAQCSKNSVTLVPLTVSPKIIDPAALANLQRATGGCTGCGDTPLGGI